MNVSSETIRSLAISPDGMALAAGDVVGNFSLLDLRLTSWQEHACQIAKRNLSCSERQQYFGGEFIDNSKYICPDYPIPDCLKYPE